MESLKNIKLPNLEELAKTHEPLSYKQLCERLEIRYLSSCSKRKQLEDLNTICKYHVTDHPTRYIVDEYYDAFAPSLINGRNKFVPYIEAILCSLLSVEEKVYLTNSEILLMCKIVNTNFTTARVKSNQPKICNQLGYDLIDFSTFVDNTYYKVLAPVVRSALTSLKRRSVISIASTYKVRRKIGVDSCVINPVPYEAKLHTDIQEIEHEAKEKFGIRGDYIYPAVASQYYDYCNKLAEEKLGNDIVGFFACKEIKSNKAIVAKELPKIYRELNDSVTERVLNSKYLDGLTNTFKAIMADDMLSLTPEKIYKDCVVRENERIHEAMMALMKQLGY